MEFEHEHEYPVFRNSSRTKTPRLKIIPFHLRVLHSLWQTMIYFLEIWRFKMELQLTLHIAVWNSLGKVLIAVQQAFKLSLKLSSNVIFSAFGLGRQSKNIELSGKIIRTQKAWTILAWNIEWFKSLNFVFSLRISLEWNVS